MSTEIQTPFILRVACPVCQADVGVVCQGVGDSLAASHKNRWDAANRKQASHESIIEVDGVSERAAHILDQGGSYRIISSGRVVDPNAVRWVSWGMERRSGAAR